MLHAMSLTFYFLTDIVSPTSLSSVVPTLIERLAMALESSSNKHEKVAN